MTIHETKLTIWHHPKIKQDAILLQSYADKAQVRLPITQQHEADKLLKLLNKKAKVNVYVSDAAHKRYSDAKYYYEAQAFPNWVKDGHFIEPGKSKEDSNGLTDFIQKYLLWTGHFANRTGNEGRVLEDGTRIKSSSINGMQDIDCNLKHPSHPFGIPWKIEIKIGKDTHKDTQKKYGKLVSKTGGVYSVVKTADEFFIQLDKLLVTNT